MVYIYDKLLYIYIYIINYYLVEGEEANYEIIPDDEV